MRAYVPGFKLVTPPALSDALALLANEPDVWRPFAGGTDLMVMLEAGKLAHKHYLNIWNLAELRGISRNDSEFSIGALTTYTEIQSDQLLRAEFPMLCQAAGETGGLAIQNRGTLGGNVVNASPAADSPPALLAYDAELELVSASGSRRVPYQGFHTGYKQMQIRADELLTRVFLPRRSDPLTHYYRKVGTRKAQAISKVCFAGVVKTDAGKITRVRIALGSVAPVPLRCVKTEDALLGKNANEETIAEARSTLASEISPIGDIRSTRDYRLRVSLNLLGDFLGKLR